MKLGALTVPYHALGVDEALDRLVAMGVEAVELGTGNYPGAAHCDPDLLLADDGALGALEHALSSRGLELSALSQHGNPLHPDPAVADAAHAVWRKTLELAERLAVRVVNAFSGCPGDREGARHPNWVTCAWPPDFPEVLEWQWGERAVPYWTEEVRHAADHGVRIGFEMHPGMLVYNPESLLRLRDACGDAVACNFDPSHLFWQGIDPVEAIRELGRAGAIAHAHAKDVAVEGTNVRRNGVLDTKPYDRFLDRSWTFRTVGYGHGEETWRAIVSALRIVGYDGVLSIEHEDGLMSIDEGLRKAVGLLERVLIEDPPADMWWA